MGSRASKNLAQIFRDRINSGDWPVGARLPTTRELSAEFGVSVNTIQAAFRYLDGEGLVERSPRRGGFVKGKPHEREPGARGNEVAIVAEAVLPNALREGDSWSYRIARAAERELARAGFGVTLVLWEPGQADAVQRLQANIRELRSRIAGAVCFPSPAMPSAVAQLREWEVPYVTVNRPDERATENFVAADNLDGGRRVGTCFAKMGLDRVVVLADKIAPGNSSMEKFAGFLQGYLAAGMPSRNVDFLTCDGAYFGDGYRTMQAHAKRFGRPRGIFATGDFLALGAIQFCREQGWDVPGDVGIVGATGLDVAAYSYPPLTVIDQPMDRMGAAAAQMLADMIALRTCRTPGKYLPSTLVIRQSLPVPPPLAEQVGGMIAPDERQRTEVGRAASAAPA